MRQLKVWTHTSSPANDGTLDTKRVYLYTIALSIELKPNVRQEFLQRYHNVKCAGCGMPVLEHEYNKYYNAVRHWESGCTISMIRKGRDREKIHDTCPT